MFISIPFDPLTPTAMETPIASAVHLLDETQSAQGEVSEDVTSNVGLANGQDNVSDAFVACLLMVHAHILMHSS